MARVWLGKTHNIHTLGLLLAGGLTLAVGLLALIEPETLVTPFQRIENAGIDLRFRLFRGARPATPEIVIVVVDEPSIKKIGRRPWSRAAPARLVDGIAQRGTKVIGLDVIYAEPEITDLTHSLQEISAKAWTAGAPNAVQALLDQKLKEPDADAQFERSIRQAGNVVLALPLVVPCPTNAGPSRCRPRHTSHARCS